LRGTGWVCSRAHAGVAVVDNALRIDVGRAHLVDAAGVVRRVGHHEHPDSTTGAAGGKLPPQRPRHRRGVLEHLVGELQRHENDPKNQRSANKPSTNPERDESTRNGLGQDYLERDPGVDAGAEELSGPGNLVPGSDVGFHGRGFGTLPARRRRRRSGAAGKERDGWLPRVLGGGAAAAAVVVTN